MLAAALVGLALPTVPASAASIADPPQPDQGKFLKLTATGECLTYGSRYRKGHRAILTSCAEDPALRWRLVPNPVQKGQGGPASGTKAALVNVGTGQCLDAQNSGRRNGAKVILMPCNGTDRSQAWLAFAGGKNQIQNLASLKCLTRPGTRKTDTKVSLNACKSHDAEQWTLSE